MSVWFRKLERASDCLGALLVWLVTAHMVGTRIRTQWLRAVLWGMLLVLAVLGTRRRQRQQIPGQSVHREGHPALRRLQIRRSTPDTQKSSGVARNTPEQNVSIALLEGVLRFETQQPKQGESAFRRALTIDPKAQLALTVSPKITETLERIREEMPPPLPPPPPPPVTIDSTTTGPTPTHPDPGKPLPPGPPGFNLSKYRLPIAIAGGGVALMGALSWTRAKSLEQQVRVADPTITTRAQLDGSLRTGRTFETVGWVLLGAGTATAIGSLVLLNPSSPVPTLVGGPTKGRRPFWARCRSAPGSRCNCSRHIGLLKDGAGGHIIVFGSKGRGCGQETAKRRMTASRDFVSCSSQGLSQTSSTADGGRCQPRLPEAAKSRIAAMPR